MSSRLFNLLLRLSTLTGKFILIFFLARFLPAKEVGLYGLVAATVAYMLYVVGLDFYTYSNREFMKKDQSKWGNLIRSQLAFFGLMYMAALPIVYMIFQLNLLPWNIAPLFIVLTVLEHLTQELNRFLIICSRQLTASLILFLRSGSWCYLSIAYLWLIPEHQDLSIVLYFWIAGGSLALLIGVYALSQLEIQGWRSQVDWSWIKKGLSVALPLLAGTLALRGIYTLDRYWFESLVSLETLGAYVLFLGICNALMSFLDAGVFMYAYPRLIEQHAQGQKNAFLITARQMALTTAGCCILFLIGSILVLPVLVDWLGKPLYQENLTLYWVLLAGTASYALGMVPHYILYAQGKDRTIVRSHFMALLVFLASTSLISIFNSYYAVPLGLLLALLIMALQKSHAARKLLSSSSNSFSQQKHASK